MALGGNDARYEGDVRWNACCGDSFRCSAAGHAWRGEPRPLVNQPLVPAAAVPGGPAFTLTVNGTGFASGAVVNWNGSPRTTTFVSSMQLTASILASDIATAGTANVTVTNPGGLTSAPQLFEITNAANMAFALKNISTSTICPPITGDFNGDGKTDVAICPADQSLAILLSNGDGTFQELTPIGKSSTLVPCLTADVNQDGKLDLILCGVNGHSGFVQVLLGNGDGTFYKAVTNEFSSGISLPMVAGDFNGDGRLDLAVGGGPIGGGPDSILILLGNGDGTFQNPISYSLFYFAGVVVGDFARSGILDLAASQFYPVGELSVLFGNGDGSFQNPVPVFYSDYVAAPIETADLNGDGILDLVNGIFVFLGNGNGTFQGATDYGFPGASLVADVNGDGVLDLTGTYAVGNAGSGISVALGKGDGTFQASTSYQLSTVVDEFQPTVINGIFNGDGRLDLLYWYQGDYQQSPMFSVLLQTNAELPLIPFQFGTQGIGTTSPPQNVTLTNVGASAFNISSIGLTGPNPGDFVIQTNGCGTSLAAGASCTVSVAFSPVDAGNLTAALSFTDSALASPQGVTLTGTGVYTGPPAVTLTPTSVAFPAQLVNTTSASVPITVMNTGGQTLIVNGVIFNGADATDFADTSDCGNVGSGASCTISVTFTPPSTGMFAATMEIIDNAPNSPQTVPVSGTGTNTALSGLMLSPTSLTLSAGQSGSFTATVTPAGGAGSVTFSCSAAPPAASCLPGTPVLNANGTLTSTIKITTTAASVVPGWPASRPRPLGSAPLVILLSALACGLGAFRTAGWLRPRWSVGPWAAWSALVVLLMGVGFMAACGGGGGGGGQAGTPPGTYMLTVTASASGQSQSSTFTLTVK
jgi:hypothetical protein